VAYFVAIHQEAWPDQLEDLLRMIRRSLASAPTLHPGRRTTRLFQRLGQPTQLLSLSEWSDEHAFRQFITWPVFVETNSVSGPPPEIEPLVPLRRFERMEQRIALASCVWVTAPPEHTAAVQTFLLQDAHESVRTMAGLVSREVYQSRETASRFLVVRSWRSMADLDRFRASHAPGLDEIHHRLGATVERFTGALAAEFSALHQ
jgi:heme-degrading monooxygenase HmoA